VDVITVADVLRAVERFSTWDEQAGTSSDQNRGTVGQTSTSFDQHSFQVWPHF